MTHDDKSPVTFLYDQLGRRKYLTTAERNAFLVAAQTMPEDERTFCLTLAYTGARISEALNLLPSHIDAAAHCIVFQTLKKRRRGIFRGVPIPSNLYTELDRVHRLQSAQSDKSQSGRRLWPWCRTTAWKKIKRCMMLAGINGPHASPKGLRHAFAISALQSSVPINFVKKWLGHARLSTTEIYAEAVGEEEQQIASRLWSTFH